MIEMAIPARKRKSRAPGVIPLALMNIVFSFSKRVAAVGLLLAPLAACTSSAAAPGSVAVVASTNVWADVARQVAGRLAGRTVHVSAIITDPAARIAELTAHRAEREALILAALGDQPAPLAAITARAYPGLAPALLPFAERSCLAHLIDLTARGLVHAPSLPDPATLFSRR